MTTGELLLKELPGSVNREGSVISGLIANSSKTGAIESAMNIWKQFAETVTGASSVYEQSDDMLDKTIEFFSDLERIYNETDDSLKNRFRTIFYRNGDTSWGNPFDVKNVFESYFSNSKVYVLENTNDIDDSLIDNGDFISTDNWTMTNAELSTKARFSKHYGILFGESGEISQSVEDLTYGYNYFLHFFSKGNINVIISTTDDDGNTVYWNYTSKKWQSSTCENSFNSDDWKAKQMYFSLKSFTENKNVTVSFTGTDCCLDYILLFQKQKYCSFTVLVYYEGSASSGSFGLAEGTTDNPDENIPPNVTVKAENWGYHNQSALTGVQSGYAQDIYDELLDHVRSCGIKAYMEFVTKDYIEE